MLISLRRQVYEITVCGVCVCVCVCVLVVVSIAYQEMVDEVTTTTEGELHWSEVVRMDWLTNEVDSTDQILFDCSVLESRKEKDRLGSVGTALVCASTQQWIECMLPLQTLTFPKCGLITLKILTSSRDVMRLRKKTRIYHVHIMWLSCDWLRWRVEAHITIAE